ncbi:UDP-3-O-acyl-N-acetylglucosamine deacetylase [Desulfonema ishimotonii]|uniref:UDP-3-O-acyl-N-acetylglucosamine deacetylase n=1 Tax=Desulfonema ishimotonii TaxID=45657 RepID=A0A401G0Z2_9BACT|nr:UDP-3-O-acyl-N-acetylglucosamine deacetylase [Desulfonema ishimotonii]GBC62853.1 UDP-3-O-acyl-N-acetylglucosamine deacetylase [Desulfonema ishimotonii]
MYLQQRTLSRTVSCSGMGVHSGKTVHLTIKPAPVNHGIRFVRTDLPESPGIRAHFNSVVDTSLATVIGGEDGSIVSTIEHLMAAFSGLSVDNALVELDNYELPIMDGSAAPFADLMIGAGFETQAGPKCFFVIREPITLEEGEKSVTLHPAPDFRVTCTIDFPHPLIGKQSVSLTISEDTFRRDIASARTFGFLREVEMMKQFGLGRGGSLDNAIIVGEDAVLNEGGLRFPDEFVRHKLLDCIGDFSLLGMPVIGHVVANRSGHAFHNAFLKKFFSQKGAWETLTVHDISDMRQIRQEALAV